MNPTRWESIKAGLVKALNVVIGLARLLPRKALAAVLTVALAGVKAANPDWQLPEVGFMVDVCLAFMACHTLSDVVGIAATTFAEYSANRYGRGVNGKVRG